MLSDRNPEMIFSPPAVPANTTPIAQNQPAQETKQVISDKGILFAIPIYVGLTTGIGAASGAIGFQVMEHSQNWTVPGITYTNFVQAMAAGSAVLSLATVCCMSTAKGNGGSNLIVGIVITASMGALNGMAGAGMLGLLTGGDQIGFAAAAGATGNAILAASMLAAILSTACIIFILGECCGFDRDHMMDVLSMPDNMRKLQNYAHKLLHKDPEPAEVAEPNRTALNLA